MAAVLSAAGNSPNAIEAGRSCHVSSRALLPPVDVLLAALQPVIY